MMTPDDAAALKAQLTSDEARKPYVYDDATGHRITQGSIVVGHPTWGLGFDLDAEEICDEAIDAQYDYLMTELEQALYAALPWAANLTAGQTRVLLDVAWNAGLEGLLGFRKMLAALERGDLTTAGNEVVHSTITPARAQRLKALLMT